MICERVTADDGVVSKHHESRDTSHGQRYEEWWYNPQNSPRVENSLSVNVLHVFSFTFACFKMDTIIHITIAIIGEIVL